MSQFRGHQKGEVSLTGGRVSLLFYSHLPLIGRGPPMLRRAICFTQAPGFSVNLTPEHPHRNTQNNGRPLANQADTHASPPL